MNYSHTLITGDFNYKDINWSTLESTTNIEHEASVFLENLRDLYLTQHVTQPTRIRENQNYSCLDLIFTNEELVVNSLEYLPGLDTSDHLVLLLTLVLQNKKMPSPLLTDSQSDCLIQIAALSSHT